METHEEGDTSEIWAELEALVGERDFEAAQEVIDDAADAGRDVADMQQYLNDQEAKLL